ncbi:MAG: ABC transporter substrate-binding protein [Azoarcus sp.]|jgi:iron complex transport system substrate-binding protein|nr:ABC transporter substrate-binding protein [Azoarcus sp.]
MIFSRFAVLLFAFSLALPSVSWAGEKNAVLNDRVASCPRIVSQSPYLTFALKWLERGDCIVGVSRYDREYPALPRTGGVLDPDQAAIAAVRPDLVVSSNWADKATMDTVTPKGARLLRVDGFGSMRDVEEMLRALATESGAPAGAYGKIADFSRQWRGIARDLASQPAKGGRRVLLISSCMGSPFSFGRQHLIGDIFAQSGFEIAETAPKIRHLVHGQDIPSIEALIDSAHPDIVVSFNNESAEYCRMIAPQAGANVIVLDGEPFVHPGPGLLRAWESMRKAFSAAR